MWPAVVRIFDLAEVGTDSALNALNRSPIPDLLQGPSTPDPTHRADNSTIAPAALTAEQRDLLLGRLQAMAAADRYAAGIAVAELGGTDPTTMERATRARDRLLDRAEPNGQQFDIGTRLAPDAYLVTFLSAAEQQECLEKLLVAAADRREAATNRQAALVAAANLCSSCTTT